MEQLNAVKTLLCSFPGWGDGSFTVDTPTGKPEESGLFPLGLQVKDRREDVLGNVRLRLRQSFLLRRVFPTGEAGAGWVMKLQNWLLQQAPQWECFGKRVHLWAENGHLVSSKQPGTGIYEVKIHVDYEKE